MRKILLLILFFLFANNVGNSYALNLIPVKKAGEVNFKKHSLPTDVVFRDSNSFYLLDAYDPAVLLYENFQKKRKIKLPVPDEGMCFEKYEDKYFICVPSENKIYILNEDFGISGSIQNSQGAFDPTDIAFYENKLYVADNDNHRIMVFNENGSLINRKGEYGFDYLMFRYPFDIAIDSRGDLFVSEVINTRIQQLTYDLKYVNYIGGWGVSSGHFYRPKGVVIYRDKYLLAADGYMGLIQVFDKKGNFIGVLGDSNGEKLKFVSPVRMKIYKDKLAVTDFLDKSVKIFRLKGFK